MPQSRKLDPINMEMNCPYDRLALLHICNFLEAPQSYECNTQRRALNKRPMMSYLVAIPSRPELAPGFELDARSTLFNPLPVFSLPH